jgi:alpha-glucosidase
MPYRRLTPLYSTDRPQVHEVIRGMRAVIDEFPGRVLIGEVYLPVERLAAYYGSDLSGAHLPFNFSLMETPWQPRALAQAIERYEAVLPQGAWPNWVLGNHDRPRLASRLRTEQARVAAMLLLSLRGTPTLYYGDEIGMHQVAIRPEQVRDPWEKNVPGFGVGRDGCRTPMQWDASAHGGFSAALPWLPLAEDFATCNVARERGDPGSLFNLYRRLTALRRATPALTYGTYRTLMANDDVLAYMREAESKRLVIALNLGAKRASFALPVPGTVLVSTDPARDGDQVSGSVALQAYEGAVIGFAAL